MVLARRVQDRMMAQESAERSRQAGARLAGGEQGGDAAGQGPGVCTRMQAPALFETSMYGGIGQPTVSAAAAGDGSGSSRCVCVWGGGEAGQGRGRVEQ